MRVLVTGGKGFIGRRLVERLQRSGDEVSIFDLVDKQDVRRLEQVREAVKGKDVVFHLAAIADVRLAREHPAETLETNTQGTGNVALACSEAGARLYYASTLSVYGYQETHPTTEESLPNPPEMYAGTKLAGENVIRGVHYSFGLQYNLMRFATTYGPEMRAALGVHILLGQALRGEPITVHGDGRQTRMLTYIDDLVDGIRALYQSGKMNGVWNLTAEQPVSALRMAEDVKRVTGSGSEIVHIAQRAGRTFSEEVSAERMLREVGWRARVGWDEGLRRTEKWYRRQQETRDQALVSTVSSDVPR